MRPTGKRMPRRSGSASLSNLLPVQVFCKLLCLSCLSVVINHFPAIGFGQISTYCGPAAGAVSKPQAPDLTSSSCGVARRRGAAERVQQRLRPAAVATAADAAVAAGLRPQRPHLPGHDGGCKGAGQGLTSAGGE